MRLGAASFALSILANITCVFAAAPIGLTRVVAFLAVNNALPHGANGINIVLPLTYRAISGVSAHEETGFPGQAGRTGVSTSVCS